MPFPWNKKRPEDLPEEIRELEPEQLAEAIKRKGELETELADLKTSVGTKDTEYKALKKELEDLKATIEASRDEGENDDDKNRRENRRTSFLENEDQAFNERAAPLASLSLHNGAQTARIIARDEIMADPKKKAVYLKYQKEIADVVKGMTPDRQIDSQVWHNALDLVAGKHIGEIMDAGNEFFAESGSTGGGPSHRERESVKKERKELTKEEKEQADRWGVPHKTYLESLKKTEAVTVPAALDTGD